MRNFTCVAAIVGVMLFCPSARADAYKFTIENTTKSKIVKLLVSEDGKKWSPFDVGKGIEPGETATMAWNEETNDQNCEQSVKAGYADGSESKVAQFDFCETGLELQF